MKRNQKRFSFKKVLVALLATSMVVSCIPLTTYASNDGEEIKQESNTQISAEARDMDNQLIKENKDMSSQATEETGKSSKEEGENNNPSKEENNNDSSKEQGQNDKSPAETGENDKSPEGENNKSPKEEESDELSTELEEKTEEKTSEDTEKVKAFLDAVAELPDSIETSDDYDIVEANIQNVLSLYQELSEEEQNCDSVNTALQKLELLQEQLGNGRPQTTDEEITYTVEWYDTDTSSRIEGKDAVTRSAPAGTDVSVEDTDKVVEGYTFEEDNDNNVMTATLKANVTTTLKLYFTANAPEAIKVFEVDDMDAFIDAIAEINNSEVGNYTISLTEDITINNKKSDGTKITFKDLTFENSEVTLLGNDHSITCIAGGNIVISVGENAILNLGLSNGSNNLTLQGDGKTTHRYALVYIDGGKVNMHSGVLLQNHIVKSALDPGAGVTVNDNGTFTMDGGTIANCQLQSAQQYGGGVAVVYGTFNMSGGTITGNVVKDCVYNNWYTTFGGGVFLGAPKHLYSNLKATFNMRGGTISNNEATYGGGVAIYTSNATFNMKGGEITGNNAVNASNNYDIYGSGGGVYVLYGVVNQTGGAIYNNTAEYVGDDVYAEGINAGNINLSAITGNHRLINCSSCSPDACNLNINGWYLDDEGARWGTTREEYNYKDPKFTKYEKTDNKKNSHSYGTTINSVGIKAAHGDPPVATTYKVEWYDVDGNTIKDTDTRNSTVGEEVSVTDADKKVDGYTFDKDNSNNVLTGTAAEDGTTTLKLYFTKNVQKPEEPSKSEEPDTPSQKEEPTSKTEINNTTIVNIVQENNTQPDNPETVEIPNQEENTQSDNSKVVEIPKTGENASNTIMLLVLIGCISILAALGCKRRWQNVIIKEH